ncbi:orotidine-5'-phosphate decarboxylase [Desulfovibrio sp. OttesenSCG-928-C06]|nr:orotidine-5'-phosphate decarboxylase [Desulfovibrio sp. OttesenSCG-928-C06]
MAELVVALDVPGKNEALELAGLLRPVTPWMKVGLELFTAVGPSVVSDLKALGCSVFLDLKFHDIPNTVKGAVRSAIAAGADICDIHMGGGEAMCRAAAEAAARSNSGQGCLLLGVTVLTSTSPDEIEGSLEDLVRKHAVNARNWGLGGVVCSGHEAAMIKQACGVDFKCLCPGIRMPEGGTDDQSRIMTPAQAVRQGADYLVVGRPITKAADPLAAARAVFANMVN